LSAHKWETRRPVSTTMAAIDLKGSTQLAHDVRGPRYEDCVEDLFGAITECAEEVGDVKLVSRSGDGGLLACGSATAAARWSLRVQTVLEEHFDLPPVRIGIACGDVDFRVSDGAVINMAGPPINLAVRLEELAGPGQIFASGIARKNAEEWLPLGEGCWISRGLMEVRGFPYPVAVSELLNANIPANLRRLTIDEGVRLVMVRFLDDVETGLREMAGAKVDANEACDRVHRLWAAEKQRWLKHVGAGSTSAKEVVRQLDNQLAVWDAGVGWIAEWTPESAPGSDLRGRSPLDMINEQRLALGRADVT
jgi:class 3 adenylate cyclase